jgi:hypothetical protein
MKCFSLKCDTQISLHDTDFLPLFRRMSNLEKLTLYLRIKNRDRCIDGTLLQNEILVYMPQLHSLTFYICTCINTVGLLYHLSSEDIQRAFTNIGQQHVASTINYISSEQIKCSIFSIPFTFDCLEDVGHMIPNIIFNYVTYLVVRDIISCNHEFFIQVARAFPLLKTFRILNMESQSCRLTNSQLYEIAEYRHLTYLEMLCGNIDYLEQFLNKTKTCVPCLTKLKVVYNNLRIVTDNFTREETRLKMCGTSSGPGLGPVGLNKDQKFKLCGTGTETGTKIKTTGTGLGPKIKTSPEPGPRLKSKILLVAELKL